jgi:outer membrane lipoprotein-sorting protein
MRWLVALLFLALTPGSAQALTPEEDAEVARLQAYLNALTTLETAFQQTTDAGEVATGRFWLHRPRRLRFEYDPPNPILIVARASFLIHFDKELKESNYLDQEDTPAWFLLAEKIEFGDQVIVRAVQREGSLIAVTAQEKGREQAGAITLVFDHDPIQLRGWRMLDPSGNHVRFSLVAPKVGGVIDPDLFEFRPTDYD